MDLRIKQLRDKMKEKGIEVMLIASGSNRRYLSGFTGSNGMVYLSQNQQKLITDFRYIEQAGHQAPHYEIVDQKDLGLLKTAAQLALEEGLTQIGFEAAHTSYQTFKQFSTFKELTFIETENWVEHLRSIKDQEEIEKIKKAESIGDLAFTHIAQYIKEKLHTGLTEAQVALEIERIMRLNGATGTSFDPIVAAGAKSSLCHATPDHALLSAGGFVVLDFGCVYEGYCSDMTRTLFIGEPSKEQKKIYETVLQAQELALAAIKPGMICKDIDQIARDYITKAGYGDYFGHGLGHSLGLDIHENPRFSAADETVLKPGMVLTVEPGIYIPGVGGVRIEDVICVTQEGSENFTASPKACILI